MTFFELLISFSLIFLFSVTLLFGLNFRISKPAVRLFFFYLVFLLITDIINKYLWIAGQNNLVVSQVFNFIELVLLSFFYLRFRTDKKNYLIIFFFVVTLVVMIVTNYLYAGWDKFDIIGLFTLKFFIIGFSLREIYLHKLEKQNRCYWINLGLVLSSAVNVSILSFVNILAQHSFDDQNWLWVFNAIVFIVALSFYSMEILKEKKWKLTT